MNDIFHGDFSQLEKEFITKICDDFFQFFKDVNNSNDIANGEKIFTCFQTSINVFSNVLARLFSPVKKESVTEGLMLTFDRIEQQMHKIIELNK